MRRTYLLLSLLAAAVLGPLPARAAQADIVVQVTRSGYADVVIPKPFVVHTEATKFDVPLPARGRFAGFVAEPLDADVEKHAFAVATVRWASGAVTTVQQNRAVEYDRIAVYVNGWTDVRTPPAAPAGRWRFHFFGDSKVVARVRVDGLDRGIVVRPAVAGPNATMRSMQVEKPAGDSKLPVLVDGRAAILGAVMVHHGPGADAAAVCIARAGMRCVNPYESYVMPRLTESWATTTALLTPAETSPGEWVVGHTAGAAVAHHAHAVGIVVPMRQSF